MNKKPVFTALAAVAAFALSSQAAVADVGDAFSKGRTHIIVTGGTGYAFDESYLVVGVGVSYYMIDGLNAGLFLESWSGSDPGVYKVTPSLQYVFHQIPVVKPYIGGFYRRTYIEGLDDLNSAGGRAGAYLQAGRNAYLGAGVVYESYIDCNKTVYRSCTSTYPELSFTIAF